MKMQTFYAIFLQNSSKILPVFDNCKSLQKKLLILHFTKHYF